VAGSKEQICRGVVISVFYVCYTYLSFIQFLFQWLFVDYYPLVLHQKWKGRLIRESHKRIKIFNVSLNDSSGSEHQIESNVKLFDAAKFQSSHLKIRLIALLSEVDL
jgi:hypothetical protein